MSFSAAIKVADIDDYVGPAAACTKPLIKDKADTTSAVAISLDVDRGHFQQIKTTATATATVSLTDCLACSGCVTSAETVLITQQSAEQFLSHLHGAETAETAPRVVVVSVSPQSRAALANIFGIDSLALYRRLTAFLHSIGVDYVFDTTSALDVALSAAADEFISRYNAKESAASTLPVICTECPGWTCYAEKTQTNTIMQHLSNVKSPQSIIGALIKGEWVKRIGADPAHVYHTCIMPCYDKKLEGSRAEFGSDTFRHVDCVLSTDELYRLITARNVDMQLMDEAPVDLPFSAAVDAGGGLYRAFDYGGSGGYAENIFRIAAKRLFDVEMPEKLTYANGRNDDIKELTLTINGQIKLRFATHYGFRNIQNLMRLIKTKRCRYDYVEVMACPGGCVAGGGQIATSNRKETVDHVRRRYLDDVRIISTPLQRAERLLSEWANDQDKDEWMRVTYRPIDKTQENGLNVKW